jgi:hypothetical protein
MKVRTSRSTSSGRLAQVFQEEVRGRIRTNDRNRAALLVEGESEELEAGIAQRIRLQHSLPVAPLRLRQPAQLGLDALARLLRPQPHHEVGRCPLPALYCPAQRAGIAEVLTERSAGDLRRQRFELLTTEPELAQHGDDLLDRSQRRRHPDDVDVHGEAAVGVPRIAVAPAPREPGVRSSPREADEVRHHRLARVWLGHARDVGQVAKEQREARSGLTLPRGLLQECALALG